ncbi:hypothetical protein Y1Q_0010278 [Alligator mississippiensis]|uniref:Uncharacterized protein n=1 Tax=Alligator mississippiensis TaxID=8496 RepID=A0A151P1H7_ALLMI|nr:hypothetical protein Y1Q_0010278 [Alligator mississippiensis]
MQATLDSRCAQSLIREDLMPPHGQRTVAPVRIACLHEDEKQTKRQWVCLQVMEHQGELLVGAVPRLACEMLLGHDWAPIYDVLDRVRDAEAAQKRIQNREGWLGELEEDEGPTDEANMLDLDNLTSSLLFCDAQEKDPDIGAL